MLFAAGVDALDPKAPHVALLVAPVPVRVLQRLFHSLSRDAYAILGTPPKALCEL